MMIMKSDRARLIATKRRHLQNESIPRLFKLSSTMQTSIYETPVNMLTSGTAHSSLTHSTLTNVANYIYNLFPQRNGEVDYLYHTPRHQRFRPHKIMATHIVLSITPTAGFYDAMNSGSGSAASMAFLHRPWTLDRRRLPRLATVVSSHKGFDEVLTVGNNTGLALRFGMDMASSGVIQGYKGDPERTIGVVGPIQQRSRQEVRDHIMAEFGHAEGTYGFDQDIGNAQQAVRAIAIMNAFHPEEVERVATLAKETGIISSPTDCSSILYLTGAVREPGLAAALERNMAVVCVGHRVCEEWGIRYLADQLRRAWPGVQVTEILEPEEPRVPRGSGGQSDSDAQGVSRVEKS